MLGKIMVYGTFIGGAVLIYLDFTRILGPTGVFYGAVIYSAAVLGCEAYLIYRMARNKLKNRHELSSKEG